MSVKNLGLELQSKNHKTNQDGGFLNYNISQKTWDKKVNFWILLEVQESTKYQLTALSRCAQARLNIQKVTTQIVSQLYLKNDLSYEVSFLHVVRKLQK